ARRREWGRPRVRPSAGAGSNCCRGAGSISRDPPRSRLCSERWSEHVAAGRNGVASWTRCRYLGAHQPMTHQDIVARGRRVLRMETEALGEAERRIGDGFARAVETIARSEGRVIVSGVGKSGLVGRKIAATLTSTGTPATFLHPADSVHGDLGIVGKSDVAILISKSGESAEVVGLLDHLKRLGVCTIALTSNAQSTLARHSDVTIDAWVKEEACPHDLAPTTSTTVALALGDALAIALLEEKGFDADDFARLHPGGAIGKRLLTRVSDLMETDKLPILQESATMREAV